MSTEFTILGAGVAGLCVASELSKRGASVTMIDPYGGPGPHGCSWWAGGMLAPDCEGETAEPAVVAHGRNAAAWWQDQGVQVTYNGSVVVALSRDTAELQRFQRRTENHVTLDRAGLTELEPQLAERFGTALHMTAEGHVTPRLALTHLRDQLEARGVHVQSQGTPSGQVIDCRGLAAKDALPDLRGVKGEMVILHAPDVSLDRPVRLLHPRFPLYIVPRGDGVFMLGATQIESGERSRATVRSVMELLSAAYALTPAFGEAEILETGVDARPAFPDNMPRIRKKNGVVYVNGLFRHGYLLAPALAVMLADWQLDGKLPEIWHEDHD
ncbi:FAD-dependent oxidoreductase [Thalassovita sp.]|jgi:glycine oxidase|uniref:FAD-dependent oxidoreductase n=1 Tax=Thalassovita sp. TaxID=1979401 RepID=UPI003B59DA81